MISKPEWFDAFMNPSFYPHPVDKVDLVQTHISWVFLAGSFVYKIKKPVDFGFLNFTTLEKRHFYCLEELRLNRRLCPQIYLDVEPVVQLDGGFHLGKEEGQIVEWCLVMRRMPQHGMMPTLIEQDEISEGDIESVLSKLVTFYKEAATGAGVNEYGKLDVIVQNTEENFDQTVDFKNKLISENLYDAIVDYTRSFIAGNRQLFDRRVEQGFIREGHGDLYSANICFDRAKDDVYIFDCIEFNKRFRCGDVASDIAFLAMDLDFHGLADLSFFFVDKFQNDYPDNDLAKLLKFYKCYRAYVRGKIACFTWADPGIDQETKNKLRQQADDYFRQAALYAGGLPSPTLFVFFGLSGTGKTTIALQLAQKKGIAYYNSDKVRKEIIAGIPASEKHLEPFGKGLYSPEMTQKTYKALARLAGRELARGHSVAVDATFQDEGHRERMVRLARSLGAKVVFILCKATDKVVKQRLDKRLSEAQPSDGRWEIYLKQKERFIEPDTIEGAKLLKVDTAGPVEDILDNLLARLK